MANEAYLAIADRLKAADRKRFLEAVAKLQGRISLEGLAEAVGQGVLTAQIVQRLDGFSEDLQPHVRVVNEVFRAAAEHSMNRLASDFRLRMSLDMVNPASMEAARSARTAALIQGVTDQTKEAVRQVIERAFAEGIPPRQAAQLIRPLVGLTGRQANAVLSFRFQLLEDGLNAERALAAANKYAAQLHRQRALLIARTETIRAATDGRHMGWTEAHRRGYLPDSTRMKWVTARDERVCPICWGLHGQLQPLGGTFNSSLGPISGPPAHPACRCGTVLEKKSMRLRIAA
jgi:hypothetical protein